MGHRRRIQTVASHINNTAPKGIESDSNHEKSRLVDVSNNQEVIMKKCPPSVYLLGSCIMDVQVRKSAVLSFVRRPHGRGCTHTCTS